MPSLSALSQQLWQRGLIPALIGLALIGFVVAGSPAVPFHGDEGSHIFLSHDFESVFLRQDIDSVSYQLNPSDPPAQAIRIDGRALTGYVIGLSWWITGHTGSELPGYWVWGQNWDWNLQSGRIPTPIILSATRLLPALLTGLGLCAVLVLGHHLDGWLTGVLAAGLLGTDAIFLLHTRRAMTESPLIALSSLSILALVGYLSWRREKHSWVTRGAGLIGLGVLLGLTVAAKQNGIVVAVVAAIGLMFLHAESQRPSGWEWLAHSASVIGLAGIAIAVALALTPYYWSDPVQRLQDALKARETLVAAQSQIPGSNMLDTPSKRVTALTGQMFWPVPEYYEAPEWANWISEDIANYEAMFVSGWRKGRVTQTALAILFAIGLIHLLCPSSTRDGQRMTQWALVIWTGLTILLILISIPLAWQRYYLPVWPCVALIEAHGITLALRWLAHRFQNNPSELNTPARSRR